MELAGYEFNGPFSDVTKVPLDAGGVYAVICLREGDFHCCLDIGVSKQLGEELKNHVRKACWRENVHGDIAFCYRVSTGDWDRDLEPDPLGQGSSESHTEPHGIESELKWKLPVVCGPNPWQQIEDYWEVYQAYERQFGPRESDGPE